MALRRTTHSVDGSIPVPALLYSDEEICASQDSVGIYDGYALFFLHLHFPSQSYSPVCTNRPTIKLAPSPSPPTVCST